MKNKTIITLTLVALFLSSCQSSNTSIHEQQTISPVITLGNDGIDTITLELVDERFYSYPNLWSIINKDKITIYSYNELNDYAYAQDGSVWMVGNFGVIHRDTDGNQTWYSIKNGLVNNNFRIVAISPSGEVWIGGKNNTLFRFDGAQWINEGEKLPSPFDDRSSWLCFSHDISGIDFGPDGSAWIMNNGIEIYRQAYGQWINFPFPKNLLPVAGGGACPAGIRVISDTDITIKRWGCCASWPVGYHFDGQIWTETEDYTVVDDVLETRHSSDQPKPTIGQIDPTLDWPFPIVSFETDYLIDETINSIDISRYDVIKIGDISNHLTVDEMDSVLLLESEDIWVGSNNALWFFSNNTWRKIEIPTHEQAISRLVQGENGLIYGATAEGVYELSNTQYRSALFVLQGKKPLVISESGEWGDCSFHKRYTILGNCPGLFSYSNEQYEIKLFTAQEDGSIIYINNRIVAKFENGIWKSFLFDTFSIDWAVIDVNGFIWIFSEQEGVFRLSPNIFDDYQGLSNP